MENTICIDKKALAELSSLAEEIQLWIESLELANDSELMASLKKSKEEIKRRDFGNWDDL